MAQTKLYFVNNGDSSSGPFDMATVVDMVNRLEIRATDHLGADPNGSEWVMICQHPEFIALVSQKAKPPTTKQAIPQPVHEEAPAVSLPHHAPPVTQMPTPVATASDLSQAQWYVLKGKNRFGPFMFVDLIRMLQEKSVFEFDFVWCQGLEAWKRVAEVPVFAVDKIRHLFDTSKASEGIFFRRHYPRNNYDCEIIVHDNSRVWKGKAIELSEGGAGVVIENAMIVPGQNIYVHFKPGIITKPFNVLSEVVSKRFMKGIRMVDAPVIYGIKFINIQKQDREAIRANIAA